MQLVMQMTSQYNTAVVCVAYYQKLWGELIAGLEAEPELHRESHIDGELQGIFARAYVFALDAIGGCAGQIAKHSEIPDACREVAQRLATSLKPVTAARDSLQHIEERVQWKAHQKRIPTSMLHLGSHSEAGFTLTTASGEAVTIEVSAPALASVRSQISDLDFSLRWRRAGPVCPECGGSVRPELLYPEGSDEAITPGLEWHCQRCGLRITSPNND